MSERLTLNSWLVQSERSMHLKCPPGLDVTQDEYLETLRITAKELELPLALEVGDVTWTDASLHQQRIRVKLTAKERFGLLTGLDYIGRVAFVEQKTYLDPLEAPKLESPNYTPAVVVGVVGLAVGGIGVAVGDAGVCFGPMLANLGIGVGIKMAGSAAAAPKKKLDEAINKWVKDVTDLARRAEVSNELNRMAQALDEAVKLAVDRLFTQRGAEMEADERKRRTASEIQTELEQRKKEGFS